MSTDDVSFLFRDASAWTVTNIAQRKDLNAKYILSILVLDIGLVNSTY